MRITPGATDEQIVEQMSTRQKRALAKAAASLQAKDAKESEMAKRVLSLTNKVRLDVYRALQEGVPARVLANRLDRSPGRIYQMQDEAKALIEGHSAEKAKASAETVPA